MFAHFFKTRTGFELILSSTPALNDGNVRSVVVANKREARAIAKSFNATCWNF